ncbi:MAG: ACT domain-containing protein [Acidobacteria bacterium]|nr:ACT domain-containing protein [Acidobacteriota bacterium]
MGIVKQLRVTLDNRPGALAQLCSELARRAVNIQAIEALETKPEGAVRLLVNHFEAARKVLDTLGLKYAEEQALAVRVGDRPGSLGKVTRKLSEKGINIEYLYGTIEQGSKRALIVLGVSDLEAAARVAR